MRKRNLKKTILAAALAVPVAFSYPGWAVRAQEDEKVSTETEAQEVMQDNTAPEEAECEENHGGLGLRKIKELADKYSYDIMPYNQMINNENHIVFEIVIYK